MWNLKKNDANELIYRTEIDRDIGNLMVPRGKMGGGLNLGIWI